MNRSEFKKSIEQTFKDSLALIDAKNADYAIEADPFSNFRLAALIGQDPGQAILLRTLDKMARISNLLNKPNAVLNEGIEDSINDACNYLAILKAYLQSIKNANTN